MDDTECKWGTDDKIKTRYSQLFSSSLRHSLNGEKPQHPRISFMSPESRLMVPCSNFTLRTQSEVDNEETREINATELLDLVRASRRETEEVADQVPALPKETENELEDQTMPATRKYEHGLYSERSVSRSRVSRVSTKRDMDIPSILAFTASVDDPVKQRTIVSPEFQTSKQVEDNAPRWSIRRSVCSVCSQKWRDRSSVDIIKNSGLKRNEYAEIPKVIVPARIKTPLMLEYVPRRTLAATDEEAGVFHDSFLRSTGPSWQLIRARKLRLPMLQQSLSRIKTRIARTSAKSCQTPKISTQAIAK